MKRKSCVTSHVHISSACSVRLSVTLAWLVAARSLGVAGSQKELAFKELVLCVWVGAWGKQREMERCFLGGTPLSFADRVIVPVTFY